MTIPSPNSRWKLSTYVLLSVVLPISPLAATSIEEANALLEAGAWEQAIASYRSLAPESADRFEIHHGLAQTLHGSGAYQEAAEVAHQACATAGTPGDEALAWNQLGRSLLARHKSKLYPEAAEAFERAARADPGLARCHEFAADKPLRLISISADQNEETLRSFIDERAMDWAMVHDGRGEIREYFGVRSFPTYLLVDHDDFVIAAGELLRGQHPAQSHGVDVAPAQVDHHPLAGQTRCQAEQPSQAGGAGAFGQVVGGRE